MIWWPGNAEQDFILTDADLNDAAEVLRKRIENPNSITGEV